VLFEDQIADVPIVSDLRMFTHPNTEQLDQVEVAGVVASALRFLSNEWKGQVQIELNIPAASAYAESRNSRRSILS